MYIGLVTFFSLKHMMTKNTLVTTWVTLSLMILWGGTSYFIAYNYFNSRINDFVVQEKKVAQTRADDLVDSIRRNLHYYKGIPDILSRLNRVNSAVSRFDRINAPPSLPYKLRRKVWTEDPALKDLSQYLSLAQTSLDVDLIYVVDESGDCIVASNWDKPESPIGTNYAERDIFKQNKLGQRGMQYAVGKTTQIAGLYFSTPITISDKFMGAVIAKVDVPNLSFLTKQTDAFLTDRNGVIILAHDKSMEMKVLPNSALRSLSKQDIVNHYQRSDFQVLKFEPWGKGEFASVQFINGEELPHVFARIDLAEYGLTVNVENELPTLPLMEQQRSWNSLLISLAGCLLIAMGGAVIFYISTIRQTKEALQASMLKHKLLFDSTRDALMMLAPPTWKFTRANRATLELFGVANEAEFNSLGPWNVSPEFQPDGQRSSEKAQKMIALAMHEGSHLFEWEHQQINGQSFPADVFLTRMEIGNELFLQATVRDISERKRIENEIHISIHQLEEKELAKSRFLAAAGHDLRQPLAAANLFIDALKLNAPTAKQEEIIQRLDQSMSTFNGLLDSLLNISKLDAGMIKPEYVSINVGEIFNWLEQNCEALAGEKQLAFRMYFPMRETLVVRADIGLLNSVLMNLVTNAIKYTSKGAILVAARQRRREVLFQVWDTGIGISKEHIPQIFDEFFQLNNPQRDRTRGLGLGLSIAKRAMALLGGEITCRSRVGRGTVFEFRLPLLETQSWIVRQSTPLLPQEEADNVSFVRGKRFVVVEDDLLVAQAMLNLIESMGGEVRVFHSAEDALQHTNIKHADYFISDYMLGGNINGIQFLNQIREKLDKPIIAVLITGDTSPSLYAQLADYAWPVLHKPVNMFKLISSLEVQEL
jgi:PAS domain S-box-containing protein